MSAFTYRCDEKYCGELTEIDAKIGHAPKRVQCHACGSIHTHKVILKSPNMKRVLTSLQPGKAANAR